MTNQTLFRDTYREISLYSPNRTPAAIDLSDNTNRWGVPPKTAALIRNLALESVTRYPNLYVSGVKEALARYLSVSPDMIVTGCGSDDVLDSTIRAFGAPEDKIAYPSPSFPMIPIFAKMNGLIPVSVELNSADSKSPFDSDSITRTDSDSTTSLDSNSKIRFDSEASLPFDIDPKAVLGVGAKIVYLCSPNNPTGTPLSRAAVEQIASNTDSLVIIDEAYAEFADENFLDLATTRSNVIVVRTMSKAFGLAGLRIGYAVGNPEIIAEIEKSRGPYKVNIFAEKAAICALTEDLDWVNEKIAEAKVNRTRLMSELMDMGFKPIPSQANFILVPIDNATEVDRQMRALGVAVRPLPDLAVVGDALRISIGPWEMMEECLKTLKKVVG